LPLHPIPIQLAKGEKVPTFVTPTRVEAARFLSHASLGYTATDIEAVRQQGYEVWIDRQFAAWTQTGHWAWLSTYRQPSVVTSREYYDQASTSAWRRFIEGRELSEVKHAQRQLESERMELDKANDELKQSAMSIEAVRVNLKDQATRFQAEGASLDQRLSAIEKRKKSAPRDQADINAINALVGAYNADTARRNKWRISLLGSQDAFNKSLAAHNATVVELNEKVAVFNKHNNEFQRSAAALAKRSEQYMSSCTGEHVIRKSSAG